MSTPALPLIDPSCDRDAWAPLAWGRWMRRWPLVFYLMVALAVVGWVNDAGTDQWQRWLPTPALVAALAAWERLWSREVSKGPAIRRRWSLPLLAFVATVLSASLTQLSLAFWLVGLALVPMLFVVLPLAWAAGIAMVLAAQAGLEARALAGRAPLPPVEMTAFLLSRGVLIVLVGLFLRSVVRQAARYQALADELSATRDELAAAERLSGTLEERHRVARELHDTLSQGLSAVIIHLETAEQLLPPGDDRAREQLRRARAVARESAEDTRRMVAALRPELLERAELPEAIARATQRFADRTGLQVTRRIVGDALPLHAEADVTLLRAVQESLNNVWKHARATEVAVTLSYMDDRIALDVRDNGVGLSGTSDGSHGSGFGLTAMRERVTQLGGVLTIESEPGLGTTVSLSLPLWRTAEYSAVAKPPA